MLAVERHDFEGQFGDFVLIRTKALLTGQQWDGENDHRITAGGKGNTYPFGKAARSVRRSDHCPWDYISWKWD